VRTTELRAPGGATLRCRIADGFTSRFLGLMGRRALPAGEALLLVPGGSIHMFFMRFAVDAVFLDAEGAVRRIVRGLRPWRVAWAPKGTRFTLELTAGQAASYGLSEGSQLELADGGWASLGRPESS
jgi:uncharacterized membrane protein (UPF0127 family)